MHRPRARERARPAPRSSTRARSRPTIPSGGVAARELHRADLLAEIAALRRCLAVTGTHGKTTTTAMVVHALRGAGLDPSYVVGGELRSTGANAGWGSGRVDRDRGRRVRPLAAQARPRDRGPDERRARPPRDLLVAPGSRADAANVHGPRGRHGGRLGPPAAAGAVPAGAVPYDAPDPELGPDGARAFGGAGSRSACRSPAPTTRSTPPAR